jgi:hypothetical protein
MRTLFIALAMLQAPQLALAGGQTRPDSGAAPEMLHVDGARNPELIPQWSVWGYVFRVIAGGPRELPTSVLRVVSKEEEAMIKKEADAVQKIDADCQSRAFRAAALLGVETAAVVDTKVRAISVACRRETLHARDRILAALNPEAAAALNAFAESTKSGTSLSLPKKDLARYLEPE